MMCQSIVLDLYPERPIEGLADCDPPYGVLYLGRRRLGYGDFADESYSVTLVPAKVCHAQGTIVGRRIHDGHININMFISVESLDGFLRDANLELTLGLEGDDIVSVEPRWLS